MLTVHRRPPLAAALAGASLLLPLAACTSNAAVAAEDALIVTASDDACEVSASEAPSGTLTFTVTNEGAQVTEFYLLAEDGLRIVGEVENIAPGLTRDLVLTAQPGTYVTACKPGMVGDGIRGDFTVTDSGTVAAASGDEAELIEQANTLYAAYVQDQVAQLVEKTRQFRDLYVAGDDDAARALYPGARVHWERVETVAESFGDLDPRMDAREADLVEGEEFTGWHRIEKDLWAPGSGLPEAAGYVPLTPAERATVADQLVADTEELDSRVQELEYSLDQIGNGAKGLLDEVATGKVTGEEEFWSHTDLWDFQANVDGARVAFEGVQPLLETKDPELSEQIAAEFDSLQAQLDAHRDGDGFVLYTALTEEQVRELSDGVNSLAEPLSNLTAALLA